MTVPESVLRVDAPVGIFDSGMGGLSVVRAIKARLPHENLFYIADSAHAPYGDKSAAYIQARCEALIRFLQAQGAKAIVVACNTATVSAIDALRAQFTLPIIGVEPGVKPALAATRSGHVGVMATTRTCQSEALQALIQRFSGAHRVHVQPCPGLVEHIEALTHQSSSAEALVKTYVSALLDKGVDQLILGCTHYAFYTPLIEQIAGSQLRIVDTAAAIAQRLAQQLEAHSLLAEPASVGRLAFSTSETPAVALKKVQRLLQITPELRPFTG